jgi:hypothetical protein
MGLYISSPFFFFLTLPLHFSIHNPLTSSHDTLDLVPVPVVKPFTGLTAKVSLLNLLFQAKRNHKGRL